MGAAAAMSELLVAVAPSAFGRTIRLRPVTPALSTTATQAGAGGAGNARGRAMPVPGRAVEDMRENTREGQRWVRRRIGQGGTVGEEGRAGTVRGPGPEPAAGVRGKAAGIRAIAAGDLNG